MPASNTTEQQILNKAYYILEQSDEGWEEDSSEYLTGRGLLNIGVGRWENYENTIWKELWVSLDDAADGDKTITTSNFDYDCPSDFVRPSSWVRTKNASNSSVYWKVVKPSMIAGYSNSSDNVCWFTGNKKDGFVLHFNPLAALTVGDTINYEYYKKATRTADADDQVEMSDTEFLAYFVAAHMAEGGLDPSLFNISEELLSQMCDANESGLELVPDNVEDTLDRNTGFGY